MADIIEGFQIPNEYRDLLTNMVVSYILDKPPDFIEYACDFYHARRNERIDAELIYHFQQITAQDAYPPQIRRSAIYSEEINADADFLPELQPKRPEQQMKLFNIIKNIFIFKHLDSSEVKNVVDVMILRKVHEGEYVIREGEDGDYFYVINNGEFEAIKGNNGGSYVLNTYVNEGTFGELSLLYNTPRACSVKAKTDGEVWALDRKTFKLFVLRRSLIKRKHYERLLEKVSILKELSPYERATLTDALETRSYAKGDVIFREGDPGDGMYFVEEGTTVVSILNKETGTEMIVTRISSGGYFGELALLTSKPRAASVHAEDNVKAAFLNAEAFERLLGPCMNIMKRNINEYKTQLKSLFPDHI